MSRRRSHDLEPDGFIALRTPLLPFDEILDWVGSVSPEQSLEEQRHFLSERLRDVYRREHVREALFIASPKLAARLDDWLDGADDAKLEQAFIRYFLRMAARPTPFGAFAGTTSGRVDKRTQLTLSRVRNHRRKTRLDMHYLSALSDELERDSSVQSILEWRPNDSLYELAGRLRYAEAVRTRTGRNHRLVAVEPSEGVLASLAAARDGATIEQIAGALIDDEVTREDALSFVANLIENQLLTSNVAPAVTGPDPLGSVIEALQGNTSAEEIRARLEQVHVALDKLDCGGVGNDASQYHAIARDLEDLPAPVELQRLFQVDLVPFATDARLSDRVVGALTDALDALRTTTDAPVEDPLARFRADFVTRYGDREIPLAEALDEETGIGFVASASPSSDASPLLADLAFPRHGPPAALVPRSGHLLRMLEEAWGARADEINLGKEDLERLAAPDPLEFPDAVAILASVRARGAEGPIACLHGASGPSGALLLGRFCAADDTLAERVRDHVAREESLQPDAAFAEIVHLPESRVGNVLSRPVLRSYEIPFLGRSGAPPRAQIPIGDLSVSVAGNRVLLRSVSLDREVVPRLTTAHNYTYRALGAYRFLCALQKQSLAGGVTWDWGEFEAASYLPRVVIGDVVVSRARWLIQGPELKTFSSASGDEMFTSMQRLRSIRSMPRFVALQDADRELVVDLDNVLSVEMLCAVVRARPFMRLVEMWPAPEDLAVEGPDGRFTNEVVIPLVRRRDPRRSPLRSGRSDAPRRFPPGSEWFFAKLYTGVATADRLLVDLVSPLVRDARSMGCRGPWFFVRYGDPSWHLRVRLRGRRDRVGGLTELLHRRARDFIAGGSLWSLQLDTYERELGRYGGPEGIEICEDIFSIDSEFVLEAIPTLAGDTGMDARWKLALVGIDRLLDDLGLTPNGKAELVRRLRDGYAVEFGSDQLLKRHIGDRFRVERAELEQLVEGDVPGPLGRGFQLLRRRSERLQAPAARLREASARERLSTPLAEIAASLAHMSTNRLLRSAHRAHELVLYDFLDRLYRAHRARSS